MVLLLAGMGFAFGQHMGANTPAAVALEPPAFLLDDDLMVDTVGQKIQDEAGIAAYYKAPNFLNLESIRPLFNSIELESPDYLLGSISVPNYDEHFDVHVYARNDGWIMAYYLSSAPTSKMIDTEAGTLATTKLTIVMNNVAVTGGAPFGNVTYYNFNYPNATHMLLVGEVGADDFEITMPSAYTYHELSWAIEYGSLHIDESYYDSTYHYGPIQLTSFLPDIIHVVEVPYTNVFGTLVVIYRVP